MPGFFNARWLTQTALSPFVLPNETLVPTAHQIDAVRALSFRCLALEHLSALHKTKALNEHLSEHLFSASIDPDPELVCLRRNLNSPGPIFLIQACI